MKKFTLETIGVCVKGYEEDYFQNLDDGDTVIAMSDLLSRVNIDSVNWNVPDDFDHELIAIIDVQNGNKNHYARTVDAINEYRIATQNEYPLIHKIKITVEAETLSKEESAKIWKSRQHKKIVEDIME